MCSVDLYVGIIQEIGEVQNQKWSNVHIETLIDAYKIQLCLYATNLPKYQNKHLRRLANERVIEAIMRLSPTATIKDCLNKFHNLRNQFNNEHAKVRSSIKSVTGTDDLNVI